MRRGSRRRRVRGRQRRGRAQERGEATACFLLKSNEGEGGDDVSKRSVSRSPSGRLFAFGAANPRQLWRVIEDVAADVGGLKQGGPFMRAVKRFFAGSLSA